jgi:type IV secretory pathway TraG/TraD family ATPase VirD4
LGTAKALAPSSDIPSHGRVVMRSTYLGMERPLALSLADSLHHVHLVGPTGSGKSTLLLGLITQDMHAGRGVVVVDPKGDLGADVLDRVPADRVGDVVVLDPADEERPVGLNLLAHPGDSPELVVDQVVSIFHELYRDSWGPRTDDILRAALLTLVGVPGMTLAEVPLLPHRFRLPAAAGRAAQRSGGARPRSGAGSRGSPTRNGWRPSGR